VTWHNRVPVRTMRLRMAVEIRVHSYLNVKFVPTVLETVIFIYY
jgi:hypothetical protein